MMRAIDFFICRSFTGFLRLLDIYVRCKGAIATAYSHFASKLTYRSNNSSIRRVGLQNIRWYSQLRILSDEALPILISKISALKERRFVQLRFVL